MRSVRLYDSGGAMVGDEPGRQHRAKRKGQETWKKIEVKVAAYLSDRFAELGFSPVKRIPILGRDGPDLTINELGLVVDVKHRKENPKFMQILRPEVGMFGPLWGVRICDFDLIVPEPCPLMWSSTSKTVQNWYDHMRDYQVRQVPNGIPAIIMHYPGGKIADSVLIISQRDWRRLHDRLRNPALRGK